MEIIKLTTGSDTERFLKWDCLACGYPHNDFVSDDDGPSLVVVCDYCGTSTPIDELP